MCVYNNALTLVLKKQTARERLLLMRPGNVDSIRNEMFVINKHLSKFQCLKEDEGFSLHGKNVILDQNKHRDGMV